MGYSTKNVRQTLPYGDVFQHHTDNNIENVRKKIIEMICRCLESRQPIATFSLPLYCKSYNLRGSKDVRATLDELAWKRSELTGKFVGCQFWSAKAKSLLDQRLAECMKGRAPTLDDAWQVADWLSKQNAEIDQKLTHEHVFPRADLLRLLQELNAPITADLVETLIERLAVGCVVSEREHRTLDRRGDTDNPWRRYARARIAMAYNPFWPAEHKSLIESAGLKVV